MSGQRISDERLQALIETSAHEQSFGRTMHHLDVEDTDALLLDLRKARAEIARLTASYESRLAEAYQALRAALATPIPTPVDREAIRAEAFEEAAQIADAEAADADRQIAENDAYYERIGRRSSFAPSSANESCRSRRIHAKTLAAAIRSAAKTGASR